MELLENINEELKNRKEEYLRKLKKIEQVIENIEKEPLNIFEIKIKSVLSFSGGKNISLIKKGSLKEVLNEAENEFQRINKKNDFQDIFLFYQVQAIIESGNKRIKIPIREEVFKKYCSIVTKSTK